MSGKRPNGDASGDVLSGLAPERVFRNLSPAALVTAALARGEARLAATGALVAETGRFTGRSPNDKYVVEQAGVREHVDWGPANQALPPERFARLLHRAFAHLHGRDVFVQDLFAGADPAHRLKVRVITEEAWHGLFARNMFIRPAPAGLGRLRARLEGARPAELRGPAAGRRHAHAHGGGDRLRHPLRADRRDALRRRAQEVDLHRPQLPAAAPGRAADALLGERRRAGARGGVLRPVRHRQDDPLGRFDPHADRRRRARLGRGRHLQLRGRLLRQGDPPRPAGRARDSGRRRTGSGPSSRTSCSTRPPASRATRTSA